MYSKETSKSKQVLLTENESLNGTRYRAIAMLRELLNAPLFILSSAPAYLSPFPTITHSACLQASFLAYASYAIALQLRHKLLSFLHPKDTWPFTLYSKPHLLHHVTECVRKGTAI